MTKVLIVGGPGSGKTTLGRSLAIETDIDLYMLDAIGWENGAGAERPIESREADIQRIAHKDAWIAEGSFMGWTDPLAGTADVIVWLDVPWQVARWRILRRHVLASLKRENQHPGVYKLWKFLRSARHFYIPRNQDEGRAQMEQWLSGYGDTVQTCRNNQDVELIVRRILRREYALRMPRTYNHDMSG